MKRQLQSGLLAASLLFPASTRADDIDTKPLLQTEAFVSNTGVLNDTKALLLVGDRETIQFRYFARDRLSLGYDGQANNFLLSSIGLGTQGFRLKGDIRMLNDQASLWAGLGYDKKTPDTFGLIELSVSNGLVGELNTVGIWAKDNGDSFNLEYQGLHWVNKESPFSGTSRLRVGFSPINPLVLGVGAEAAYGLGLNTTVQLGGFVRIRN